MEIITTIFTFACLLVGLFLLVRPLIKRLLESNNEFNQQIKLVAKYKRTTLWRELSGLIGNGENGVNLNFEAIQDRFQSYEELSKAIKRAGLESCNLIIGVDFTASNEWQGRRTFGHRSLHHIVKGSKPNNPYQRVISAMAETLSSFDDDNLIPVYGFGDKITKDKSVFPFNDDEMPCRGFDDVLRMYNEVVQKVELSGPTSFAPIIRKAMEVTKKKKGYHILLIVADGQVKDEQDLETRKAIVEASFCPLSIILVGVGDGPWNLMSEYDEKLPKRNFDNFQFVDYHRVTKKAKNHGLAFALNALMEIPDQYNTIKNAALL